MMGKKYTHYSKANYYVNPKMRAFVDPEQMEWLKKDLESTDKKCIIFLSPKYRYLYEQR